MDRDTQTKGTIDLDPGFESAGMFHQDYETMALAHSTSTVVGIALERPDGTCFTWRGRMDPSASAADSWQYIERTLKFLLWQKGGSRVWFYGERDIFNGLEAAYAVGGERAFDAGFIGETLFGEALQFHHVETIEDLPAERHKPVVLGRNMEGCRIGFDLGGSDRKAAALIDGEVVYSEEIRWDPYFQTDPNYHIDGIRDSLARAAAHVPRVDAIGGSAAGVYVNNMVRGGSLFRGVPAEAFESKVRNLFIDLKQEWGGIPFDVVNDGEVTALAGSMSLNANAVLGVALGTSEAVGYVNPEGGITPWLNELAFAPIDLQPDAPIDEWSGDCGCGVNYLSQQGVARLAARAGFNFESGLPYPEQLIAVQEAMQEEDPRALSIFHTMGKHLAHAVAHYANFYEIEHILTLGRVTSGQGGEIMVARAQEVLKETFPDLAERIGFCTLGERDKRHGQAVAAASLPTLP